MRIHRFRWRQYVQVEDAPRRRGDEKLTIEAFDQLRRCAEIDLALLLANLQVVILPRQRASDWRRVYYRFAPWLTAEVAPLKPRVLLPRLEQPTFLRIQRRPRGSLPTGA